MNELDRCFGLKRGHTRSPFREKTQRRRQVFSRLIGGIDDVDRWYRVHRRGIDVHRASHGQEFRRVIPSTRRASLARAWQAKVSKASLPTHTRARRVASVARDGDAGADADAEARGRDRRASSADGVLLCARARSRVLRPSLAAYHRSVPPSVAISSLAHLRPSLAARRAGRLRAVELGMALPSETRPQKLLVSALEKLERAKPKAGLVDADVVRAASRRVALLTPRDRSVRPSRRGRPPSHWSPYDRVGVVNADP